MSCSHFPRSVCPVYLISHNTTVGTNDCHLQICNLFNLFIPTGKEVFLRIILHIKFSLRVYSGTTVERLMHGFTDVLGTN